MSIRRVLSFALISALCLAGVAGIAVAEEKSGKKNNLACGESDKIKKLNVKIDIPLSSLRLKIRKPSKWIREGIHGPGDFWRPEMLERIRSRKK